MNEVGGVGNAQGGSGQDLSIPGMNYTIQEGDSLRSIVIDTYGLSGNNKQIGEVMQVIARNNGIKDPNKIKAKRQIQLPWKITLPGGVVSAEMKGGKEPPVYIEKLSSNFDEKRNIDKNV